MEGLANTLPFDALCAIFEHYVTLDRPSQPQTQETLLLVSRSWYKAASNHAILWTDINLHITRWEEMEVWASCLARRLVRYSANALLDIRITMPINTQNPPGGEIAHKASERLLLTLVGESGTIARRWRSFVVGRAFVHIPSSVRTHSLSFPTPNLQEFGAVFLRCDQEILPDTSSLKSFSIIDCILLKFPILETVTHLTVSFVNLDWNNGLDERAMVLARNLQSLKIRTDEPYKLSVTYPLLRSLELQGSVYEDCLTEFHAPNLDSLTLIVSSEQDYYSVISCAGVQLKNVKTAQIGISELAEEAIPAYLDGVRQFLIRLVNLETLIFYDPDIVHFALKLLTGDCEHLYQSHAICLVLHNERGELGRGDTRLSSVNRFRQQTRCLETDTLCILLNE